ncbi:MAG: divergent polysaccharide deacetylase family protein [Proteobacteria bacterium]|nr:divergent polysaccharide deacetylase family protein [Pseudomonadota bacterium]
MNPLRQAAFVCLALAGIAIGYWAGYLTKGESPPTGQEAAEAPGTKNGTKNGTKPATKPAPTAPKTDAGISSRSRTAAPPLLPEKGIAQQVGPLRAYEEALPEDIIDDPAGPAVIAPSERSSDAKEDGPATPVRGKSIASWESPPAAEKSPDPPPEIPAETPKDAPKPTASKALPGADTPPQAPEQRDPPKASPGPPAVPAVPREAGDLPAWKRFAVAVAEAAGRPRIAIVIDDLGIDKPRTARAIRLPGPLTLSFMTYATGLGQQTRDARSAGHELLMHIPMEPGSLDVDPGPNVLLTGVPRRELLASLNWNLDQFGGYVGVNNHMGSRFTADLAGMTIIMEVLKKRQLLFLDSLTASNSQAREAARKIGVPFAGRNVFLDHVDDVAAIEKRLHEVERLARRTGVAIAIGHPREATLQALLPWLKGIEAKGFQLIPLSAVLKTRVSRG